MTEKLKLIIGMLEEEVRLIDFENAKPWPSHSNFVVSRARLRGIAELMINVVTDNELSLVRRVDAWYDK